MENKRYTHQVRPDKCHALDEIQNINDITNPMITQNFRFTVTKDYVFRLDEFDPPFFFEEMLKETQMNASPGIFERIV